MKILCTSLFLILSCASFAQKRNTDDINQFKYYATTENGEVTVVKQSPTFIGNVPGSVGSVYTGNQIFNMPTRSINKVASLTLGVQGQFGETPIFKGALGGTAYFVDGVRIRSGSIGVVGFSY